MGCMIVFDERKCVVVTKLTSCRIVATGIHNLGNGLHFLKFVYENLQINFVALDLPSCMQHNLSTLEVNSLPCPSHIASYSPSDTLQREESVSLIDHSSLTQGMTT